MKKIFFVVFIVLIFSSCASDMVNIEATITYFESNLDFEEDYTYESESYNLTTTEKSIKSKAEKTTSTIELESFYNENEDLIPRNAVLAYSLDGINFRIEASFDSEVIRKINSDEKIYILDDLELYNDFYHITDGENVGYMFSDYVFPKEGVVYNIENGKKLTFYTCYSGVIIDSKTFLPADTTNYVYRSEYLRYIMNHYNFIDIYFGNETLDLNISSTEVSIFSNVVEDFLNNTVILHSEKYSLNSAYDEYVKNSNGINTILNDDQEKMFLDIIFESLYKSFESINENFLGEEENKLEFFENTITNNTKYDFCIKAEVLEGQLIVNIFVLIR